MAVIKCSRGQLFDNRGKPIPVKEWLGATIGVVNPITTVEISAPAEVVAGSEFSTRLNVDSVEDLDAFQVDIDYDPGVFSIIGVDSGLIGGINIPIDDWGFVPSERQGRVRILGNVAGVPRVSGSGYLTDVTFHAK